MLTCIKKETDRNQYLLPSSCHSKQTTAAIPYSLALRIVRTCIDPLKREKQFIQLKTLLTERDYNEKIIDSAISRARNVPRKAALRKIKQKSKEKGPVLAVTYDPRLPSIGPIVARHWRTMTSRDVHLSNVFKRPPLIAFKRQKNLRQHLIKAKVPDSQKAYPKRSLRGMAKCGQNCTSCPYVQEGKVVKIN